METPADAVNEQIPENLLQKINAYWRGCQLSFRWTNLLAG